MDIRVFVYQLYKKKKKQVINRFTFRGKNKLHDLEQTEYIIMEWMMSSGNNLLS